MESEKKWSKAFSSYMDNFVNVLRDFPGNPSTDDGKKKFYFKDFETHSVKDSEFKESSFVLCEKGGNENVKFVINSAGTLMGAEYVNFENYNAESTERGKGVERKWVGKNLDELTGLVKSEGLRSVVSAFDWSKSADKTADAPEIEAEEPEIG